MQGVYPCSLDYWTLYFNVQLPKLHAAAAMHTVDFAVLTILHVFVSYTSITRFVPS